MTGITDYDLDDERVGMAYEIACYEIDYLDSFSDDPDYDPAVYAVEILKRFDDPEFVRTMTDDFEREALWNHSDPGQNLKARTSTLSCATSRGTSPPRARSAPWSPGTGSAGAAPTPSGEPKREKWAGDDTLCTQMDSTASAGRAGCAVSVG